MSVDNISNLSHSIYIPISLNLIQDAVLYADVRTAEKHQTLYNMALEFQRSIGLLTAELWEYDKYNVIALRIELEAIQKRLFK